VWFSTLWTARTKRAFLESVSTLVTEAEAVADAIYTDSIEKIVKVDPNSADVGFNSKARKAPEDAAVLSLLRHWAASSTSTDVDSAMAQSCHGKEGYPSNIGLFLESSDRVAMAKYELTGAFTLGASASSAMSNSNSDSNTNSNSNNDRNSDSNSNINSNSDDGDKLTGSTVMFDVPLEGPHSLAGQPLVRDETVFSTLALADIGKNRRPDQTFVGYAEERRLQEVSRLIARAKAGDIEVELRCGAVEAAASDIAELRPWSMR
jgi:hypothetical protein